MSRTVCVIASRNAFDASAEQQVRLVEEEDELGLVEVAHLGQVVEEVGEQPHQERREQRGLVLDGRAARGSVIMPAAVGRRAAAGRWCRTPARRRTLGAAGPRSSTSSRRITPAVAVRQAAEPVRSALPSSRDQVLDDRAQVLEVQQGEPGLVGVVEDQAEARLLGLVEVEHLGQQHRAEAGDAWPAPGRRCPSPPSARNSDRVAGRPASVWPMSAARCGRACRSAAPGCGDAGQVALDVGEEHRHARAPRAARPSAAGSWSCRCRWRRRPGRAG